jgi:ribosomal protein S18 acetylase RimI-like enzyme
MRIEQLADYHDRDNFDCGEPALDDFLKRRAGQQQKRNVGKTFVAVPDDDTSRVLGFYTLAAGSIQFEHLPPDLQRKLPKYPIPSATLGRLAIDRTAQGQGIGKALLCDALNRVATIAERDMGIVAVIVDAKNGSVQQFYRRYGFQPLMDQPGTLFLLTAALTKAMPPK